jgi:hypothetical protein
MAAVVALVLIAALGTASPASATITANAPDGAACHPWQLTSVPDGGGEVIMAMDGMSGSDIWGVTTAYYAPHRPHIVHWDGTAWTSSPNTAADGYLYAVDAISGNDAWAVGSLSGIQRTLALHWDGSVWQSVPVPSPMGSYDALNGVSGTGPSDVWAVGITGYSTGLITHWDGVRWSLVQHPEAHGGQDFEDVLALAPDDAWAVGRHPTAGGGPFLEHWDGTAWANVPLPDRPPVGDLNSLDASGPNDVWALGGELIYRFDGSTWTRFTEVPFSRDVTLSAVSVLGPDDVWVAGGKGFGGPPETAHWNGSTWSTASVATKENGALSSIKAFAHGDVWAGGYGTTANAIAAHYVGCHS